MHYVLVKGADCFGISVLFQLLLYNGIAGRYPPKCIYLNAPLPCQQLERSLFVCIEWCHLSNHCSSQILCSAGSKG